MTDDHERSVRVAVATDRASDWTVDPNVFGRFAEHLGGAIYPGVFEEYVRNGSFDVWNRSGNATGLAFPDVDEHDGVAYPWEPRTRESTGDRVAFEQRVGGVRGRSEATLVESEVPGAHALDPPGVTEPRYQRLVLDGEGGVGGVGQRVALPDRREATYEVSLSVRGELAECAVRLDPAGDDSTPLARETVPVDGEWERHTVELTLDRESPRRYAGGSGGGDVPEATDSAYGEYYLTVAGAGAGAGTGVLDVDWVTLRPDDAVEGMFNPVTVERLRECNVTSLRWPGGNYASQYRWRHGVGPVADRPVTPVVNWGGLDPNYLGTDEWLRFCELVDAEPYVTVPFWSAAGPGEAAAWVEYCNGSTATEMGALRAEHGHPEPWDVTWWGVGNEVWGSWQVGRADAASYAERYGEYHDAMRAVDPGIEIDACGIDPWFTLVHDGSREGVRLPADGGEPPVWNDLLLEGAGGRIEGLDVHRYVEGISDHTSDPGARAAWLDANDETPLGYVEALVNDPGSWDRLFEDLRSLGGDHGIDDLRLTVGEWGLRSGEIGADWPRADRPTMAHAAFAARALQAFLRNGDDVELAHWTDFSLYARPGEDGSPSPPHPGARVVRDVAGPIVDGEGECHRIETAVSGSPTLERPATGVAIPAGEVPLVDAVTVGTGRTDGTGPHLQTLLVNGSLRRAVDVTVDYGGGVEAVGGSLFAGRDGDPFARGDGNENDGYEVETFEAGASPVEVSLPPASVAILSGTLPE